MRLTINLATRPYVELHRIFLQLRLAIAGLAVLAVGLGLWLHAMNAQAREQQRQIEVLNAQAADTRREHARNEARMRQPANAQVLERAEFLNALFTRKSFSWTAVLMDLEQVLPSGVQVTSIEPQILANGEVDIRLRVVGERDRAVLLVRNLEGSHRFIGPRLAGEALQQQQQGSGVRVAAAFLQPGQVQQTGSTGAIPGGVEFEIISGYNPLQPRVREQQQRRAAQRASVAEESAPEAAQ